MPLTKKLLHVLKILGAYWLKNCCLSRLFLKPYAPNYYTLFCLPRIIMIKWDDMWGAWYVWSQDDTVTRENHFWSSRKVHDWALSAMIDWFSKSDPFVDGLWVRDGFRIINYDVTRLSKRCMLILCAGCRSVLSGLKFIFCIMKRRRKEFPEMRIWGQ